MNKFFFTILAIAFAFSLAEAEDVKLKITYKGSGLSDHKVTVLVGGAAVGSGVTDGSGNVTISVSALPSNRIDLKGEKKCNNAQKSWSADGYVTLDGNNYGELKLDELTKMMADASGGFLTEEGLAKSYGCICAGASDEGGEEKNAIVSDSSAAGKGLSTFNNIADAKKQREEQLESKKQFYTTKLESLDNKMERKNRKMAEYDEKEKQEALYEIREWQIEKKMTQNDLDRINMQLSKKSNMLNKEEKREFDDREELLKEDMDALKADKKAGKTISEDAVKAEMALVEKKSEEKKETVKEDLKEKGKKEDEEDEKEEVKEKSKKEIEKEKEELAKEEEKAKQAAIEKQKEADKEAEKARLKKEEEEKKLAEEEKAKAEKAAREDLIYTPDEFANMSKSDLGKEKFGLKSDLSKLELKISTRKKSMTPNELTEAEARVAKLEAAIKSIEEEQARRGNEVEAENLDSTKTTQTVSDTLTASSDTAVSDGDDLVYTEADFANMSKNDLGKKKLGLKSDLSKLELKLSTRKKSMTPNELAEAEARKIKLEEAIKAIEAEQEKRKAEKE